MTPQDELKKLEEKAQQLVYEIEQLQRVEAQVLGQLATLLVEIKVKSHTELDNLQNGVAGPPSGSARI